PTTRPVVLVTGASSGIGRATAQRYLGRGGAVVLLVGRRIDALRETVDMARLGPGAEAHVLIHDLAEPGQTAALAKQVRELHGRLDVLVNNAGVGSQLTFEDSSGADDIDRLLDTNLRAPIHLMHDLFELLSASGGAVVNVSSVAGLVGTPDSPVYSATKWGLTGVSEALHVRWKPTGVHVACVQPGPVPTPGWPNHHLMGSWIGRRLTASADDIARAIVRAGDRQGPAFVTRPRAFGAIHVARAAAPGLLRTMLQRVRSGTGSGRLVEHSGRD
ncbi:MAG: family NAD(P)-dependent oxidoreductase, partial [Thermoleophilia bacterium]|nr:family NAD(P)-dependent oxidoreductase [Thermoleophilia bacterium]